MVENLKVTKYNDGTDIPLVTVGTDWANTVTPAYCWYNNNFGTFGSYYGALYNWHTVNTGKLCPPGWHVPTDEEWTILTDFLGGKNVAGGKLKETGTTHWYTTDSEATNETGFTVLPGGTRYINGAFLHVTYNGYWWTSTGYSSIYADYRAMYDMNSKAYRNGTYREVAYSVRCIKD